MDRELRAHEGALLLYGFDARAPIDAADPAWTAERREAFLLRTDIRRPLSVDRSVWPPVAAAQRTDGAAPDYWASLGALRDTCAAAGLGPGAASLVALAVREGPGAAGRALVIPCDPGRIQPVWTPLGYDVADTGLTSASSNSGFLPGLDDVELLRRAWGPRLNEHGLFDALPDAVEFRGISDDRMPEHAPFLVHRLYLVPW